MYIYICTYTFSFRDRRRAREKQITKRERERERAGGGERQTEHERESVREREGGGRDTYMYIYIYLLGKYNRYAVFLNCFSNSLRCLWEQALSGRHVRAWVRTIISMLTCNGIWHAPTRTRREPHELLAGWRSCL